MGNKTKIDWADATWNPVTGCLHGCEYCYARRIAERFGGCWRCDLPADTSWRNRAHFAWGLCESELIGDYARHSNGKCHVLDEPEIECAVFDPPSGYRGEVKPYPYSFDPTFHRYKLDEPRRWKKPRNIFVCSMADLFGEWVPDEWIDEVVYSTQQAKQHRYLFLTKNPSRYGDWLDRFEHNEIKKLSKVYVINNLWFGASASSNEELEMANRSRAIWLSIEPIRERIKTDEDQFMEFRYGDGVEQKRWEWVIIGAETGNSKRKVIPQKAWIDEIMDICRYYGTPVFMKESLRSLMGDDFRQEFPWKEG